MIPSRGLVALGARAWVADGSTGALCGADGTIDWWCPERTDGTPVLSRLLDEDGGAVRIAPAGGATNHRLRLGRQRYVPGSNVVVTTLTGADSAIEITDLLAWPGPGERPAGRLVRLVTATAGRPEVDIEVAPGGRWGPARKVAAWSGGVAFDGTVVRSGVPMVPVGAGRDRRSGRALATWRGRVRLDPGQSVVVTVEREGGDPPPALRPDGARRLIDHTVAAWQSWLAPAVVDGPYAPAAARSLLAVRSLVPFGSGAPWSAATTSLPRRSGGERQWDGRITRLGTVAAWAATWRRLGLAEDADAAEQWLRDAVADTGLDRPWPAAVLDADGRPAPAASEIAVSGWRNSQPVITGAPTGRLDLDGAGDLWRVVRAAPPPVPADGGGDRRPLAPDAGPLTAVWPALARGADWLCDHWTDPDHGVWLGGAGWGDPPPAAALVASRLRVAAALGRAAAVAQAADPFDLAAAGWRQCAGEILGWVEATGAAAGGGLRRDPSPADWADAALLRVAWEGPWPPSHPRVPATVNRVLERLGNGPWLYRYPPDIDDGAAGADSPDVLATVWAVRALAALGRWEEAHERMEAVVDLAGPLGLLGGAVDPLTGEILGNFPDSAVHGALVDAAMDLAAGPT